MFDLSFAEILVIIIFAIIFIGPKELPTAINFIKKTMIYCRNLIRDISNSVSDIEEVKSLKDDYNSINAELTTIIDLNGNPQIAYDVSETERQVKEAIERSKKANEK